MYKNVINLAYMQFLFVEVAFASDNDLEAEILNSYDLNNVNDCTIFIQKYLQPVYIGRSDKFREMINSVLFYVINTGNYDYVRLQQSCCYEIDLPENSIEFSKNIYGILNNKDEDIFDIESFVIIDDAVDASKKQWD